MTATEILKELKDIHLPDTAGTAAPTGLALWPFVVLGTAIVLVAFVRWRRARAWTREARAELRAIDRGAAGARWSGMIGLLRRIAGRRRYGPPPAAVYRRPDRVDDADLGELRAHLGKRLGQ